MADPTDLSAVEALLAERDALQGWLDRLDQRGGAAPESVRLKVRQDYQSRLDRLIDRLRAHADAVAARLLEDQAERERLEGLARASREALAEAELRHAVGEFDADRFEAERGRHVRDLEQLEASLDAVVARITGLEDVHFAVTRGPAAGAGQGDHPATEPEQPQSIEAFLVEEPETTDAATEALVVEPEATEPQVPDDLLSIFDEAERAEARERAERPPPPAAPLTPAAGFGPLSFTPTGIPEVSGPVRPVVPPHAPPIGMPAADQSPRFVRPGHERGSELVELPAERVERIRVVPDPEPVLPEVSADAGEASPRTLRCGECGAMNRPLEWYCEKCGAELTTI